MLKTESGLLTMAEKEYIERTTLEKFVSSVRRDLPLESPDFLTRDIMLLNFEQYIHLMPAADVAPVRHGRWKKSKGNERPTENGFVHDDRYVCDCCGWGCCCETKLDFSYCPNCGAKMDGDKNGS